MHVDCRYPLRCLKHRQCDTTGRWCQVTKECWVGSILMDQVHVRNVKLLFAACMIQFVNINILCLICC